MNDKMLHETHKSDIESIIAVEADVENTSFIIPNSKDEHFN